MLAASPISASLSPSARGPLSAPESELTRVTSSPSRIQVTPRAQTTSQWKRLQGNRSSRAGTSVVNTPGVSEGTVVI